MTNAAMFDATNNVSTPAVTANDNVNDVFEMPMKARPP
eukprot:CAMPEP_0172481522 /NCGR_PEP_ID=MMETSP1066-20121228/7455_1 /TAXON_ID=671091 /ORGANISM="Coscinodiscus wailesii, Strain CCMP2513" /LENGTH=37 /DNA_ID= /DNA_START= /DNA_END= /DNA_ORIENTATION=